MKPKCKPGDIAIVIWAHNPQNIGAILHIKCKHPFQNSILKPKGDTVWSVESPYPMTYESGGRGYQVQNGPAPDSQLQPIRGSKKPSKKTRRRGTKSLSSVEVI